MLSKLRLVKELRLEIKTRNELQLKVFIAQGNKTTGSDCCVPFTCSFNLWLFCLFVQNLIKQQDECWYEKRVHLCLDDNEIFVTFQTYPKEIVKWALLNRLEKER